VESDELALACRLSGLSLADLWLRYLEVGGSRGRLELEARLGGARWPEQENRYLSVVADEALRERGLPRLASPAQTPGPPAARPVLDEDPDALRRTTAAVLATRTHGNRLTTLFERCAHTREDARWAREQAQAFRRGRGTAVLPFRGGR